VLLKNIDPDVINAQIGLSSSVEFNEYLYFSANNGTSGVELWKTDGTKAGTALVADLYPGADGSGPFDFNVFNGNLFFRAESASAGVELWSCVAVTSSVADVELGDIVSVYPNPSTGVFNLKSKSTLKEASIKVYSIYGQVVFETDKVVSEIDLSNQPAGVYFIQLKSGETFINKRIVIQ
jgi:ELWxxDGT repeat protein